MTTEADTTIESEDTGDTAGERTRRAVLAGSAIGAAALLGTRPTGVAAAVDGDPIVAGGTTTATSRTNLRGPSLVVTDGAASGSLAREVVPGVVAGVHGFTSDDTRSRAVWGLDETDDGVGVYAAAHRAGRRNGRRRPVRQRIRPHRRGHRARRRTARFRLDVAPGRSKRHCRHPRSGRRDGQQRRGDALVQHRAESVPPHRRAQSSEHVHADRTDPVPTTHAVPQPEPGALPVDGARIVSLRLGRDLVSGAVIDGRLISLDAIAVSFNLTAINTFGRGFLAVSPGDALAPRASTLNWRGDGELISNSGIAKLDANGNVKVFAGGQFGYADFFLDVTGYYA